jgi:secreted trypsin-like serine protease
MKPRRTTLASRSAAAALIALVACVGCGVRTEPDEVVLGSTREAITNGVDDDDDPAVVALLTDGRVVCSGVLVTKSVVLTAAHCVARTVPETVLFGTNPRSASGTLIKVRDAHAHPNFDPKTFDNDIALVALAEEAPATPLPIATQSVNDSDVGREIRVVGFGSPGLSGDGTLHKRSGQTKIESYGWNDFRFRAAPSQTCNGDSGGPAVARIGDHDAVIGITSSGDPDCLVFGRDIRIDRFASFVQDYVDAPSPAMSADDAQAGGCSAAKPAPGNTGSPTGIHFVLYAMAALVVRARRPRV